MTLVPVREINELASAYLEQHPELYEQALERAKRMGWYVEEQHSEILVTPDYRLSRPDGGTDNAKVATENIGENTQPRGD